MRRPYMYRKYLGLIILLCVITSFGVYCRQMGPFQAISDHFEATWVKVLAVGAWPARQLDRMYDRSKHLQALVYENQKLHDQVLHLSADLYHLKAMQRENIQLKDLLSSSSTVQGDFVVADLLAVINIPGTLEVLINRGKRSGVYPGQPVLDAKGVIGQVTRVYDQIAKVQLIQDKRSVIPVQLASTGMRSFMIGTGQPHRLRLQDSQHFGQLKVGDVFVTSGLGLKFPEGYPVAEVESILKTDQDIQVVLKPKATPQLGRHFLLVWPTKATLVKQAHQVMHQAFLDQAKRESLTHRATRP